MALFSRKNIKSNPYGLTKDDLKGELQCFPMGVVVRMMEEQELQGNKSDVTAFQSDVYMDVEEGGFYWCDTEAGEEFWDCVIDHNIKNCDFKLFFEKYPDYARYNLA